MVGHDVPIRVDHVGIAVESVADAEPILLALGCEKLIDDTVEDRFRWVYFRLGDASRIELIEPLDTESFLTRFLDEHGPGLHHVTLEVGNVDAIIEVLESHDVPVVEYREYEEWTEAFVSPSTPTGTLFQLMEFTDTYRTNRNVEKLFVNGVPVDEGNQDPNGNR